jgi:hypothetical protein
MRFSLERLTVNAPVATVLGSIPASVGTWNRVEYSMNSSVNFCQLLWNIRYLLRRSLWGGQRRRFHYETQNSRQELRGVQGEVGLCSSGQQLLGRGGGTVPSSFSLCKITNNSFKGQVIFKLFLFVFSLGAPFTRRARRTGGTSTMFFTLLSERSGTVASVLFKPQIFNHLVFLPRQVMSYRILCYADNKAVRYIVKPG